MWYNYFNKKYEKTSKLEKTYRTSKKINEIEE